MSIFRYAKGYLRIRVIGYSPERFLNACSHRGIYLWDITPVDNAYEMYVSVSGFRRLKPVIRKTRTKVVIIERLGLPFYIFRYRKRKTFFIGMILGIALIYLLSLFIWDIDIRGNRKYTDEALLSFLKDHEVRHGMWEASVDCGRIVKDIRKEYDEIIWVSASIEGCRLIIQIKENEDSRDVEETKNGTEAENATGEDLVSDYEGTVREIIVRRGIPLVKEGDKIEVGDILVTGAVPVVDDSGMTTGYQLQKADADIRVQVSLEYEQSHPLTYLEKNYEGLGKKEVYLRIGDTVFSFGSHKTKKKNWDSIREEKVFRLGDSFYFPISWGIQSVRPYQEKQKPYSSKELQNLLSKDFYQKMESLEKKGVEIIENDVKIYTGSTKATVKGTLSVVMNVGVSHPTDLTGVEQKNAVEEVPDGND